jgi:hypothetical protein
VALENYHLVHYRLDKWPGIAHSNHLQTLERWRGMKIENCPFCEQDKIAVKVCDGSNKINRRKWHFCRCLSCGADGPVGITKYIAIKLWNAALELRNMAQRSTKNRSDEIALFENIYEVLCGVGDAKIKGSVVAEVNARIVQLRAVHGPLKIFARKRNKSA